jgi:DNA-directed RNA polymerase subunit RPC12/RpoP
MSKKFRLIYRCEKCDEDFVGGTYIPKYNHRPQAALKCPSCQRPANLIGSEEIKEVAHG